MTQNLSLAFIGQQLEGAFTAHDLSLASIGNKKGRTIPLNHHNKESGWIAKPSAPHPTIVVNASPCPRDHVEFGHQVSAPDKLQTVKKTVIADTGCMSTAIPPRFAYEAGLKKKTLSL